MSDRELASGGKPRGNGSGRPTAKLLIRTVGGEEKDEPVIFPLLGPEILIGRMDSADLVLDDPSVSRIHAKIVRDGEANVIVDLESSTGTMVNGAGVTRHALRTGDIIEIASARMEYRE